MIYYLKNKDEIILEFEVISIEKKDAYTGKNFYEQKIASITQYCDLLPLNIDKNDLKKSLETWIDNRKVPKNRAFVEKIVSTYSSCNQSNFMDYIDVSLGLSLNDSFWIIPSNKDYKWADYNLYDNKFDEALELVAFKGNSHKISKITLSAEYTTNGMQKKCWHRDNDKIYLYKGSTLQYANGGKDAFCEYYMAQIADILNLEHISYNLKEFHNEIVSACELFTSEKEGYCPIHYFLSKEDMKKDKGKLVEAVTKTYALEKLQDVLLFDAIIYNADRHLSNFGMIVDNDTLEIIRPAPIFDNGFSIMNYLMESELDDIEGAFKDKSSFFGYSFDEQLSASVQKRHLEGLEKLKDFKFIRHPEFNLDEKWLKPIENFIQKRAQKAITFLYDKFLELNNQNDVSYYYNSYEEPSGSGGIKP